MNVFQRILVCSLLILSSRITPEVPKLTIVLVVDQFPYRYLQQLKPYLRGGIGYLHSFGINYKNAYYPHALPTTAAGHAGLNTGTYAKDNGFTANSWYENGVDVECDYDNTGNALVFSNTPQMHSYGKSAKNLMVDGVSDQFILNPALGKNNQVYALSFKSRAAIATGSKLGKSIWFDDETGQFTSSKAYFNELPSWLTKFNNEHVIKAGQVINWPLVYPRKSIAYQFPGVGDYEYAESQQIAGKSIQATDDKGLFNNVVLTPFGNQLLFDLAQTILAEHYNRKNEANMLLWIDLSSFDKIGHKYGPQSLECFDFVYHLDRQIRAFMKRVEKLVNPYEVLWAFTSDHGIEPIPEMMNKAGIPAYRIDPNNLIKSMNEAIASKHKITDLVKHFAPFSFYLDEKKLEQLTTKQKKQIFADLKASLLKHPGIQNAWSIDELKKANVEPGSIEQRFRDQLYPERTGQLVVLAQPYSMITSSTKGTFHDSPYEYNTHVPLLLYQKKLYGQKEVTERVNMLQFANTMAEILQIPKPSCSTFNVLPGLFNIDKLE